MGNIIDIMVTSANANEHDEILFILQMTDLNSRTRTSAILNT